MSIEAALSYIDPQDRHTWVRMGMAIKSELGDSGFDVWDQWSQTASNYRRGVARQQWKSFKVGGGITIGSLYFAAQEAGWRGEREQAPAPRRAEISQQRAAEERETRELQRKAAQRAQCMASRAEHTWHQYLVDKGFPQERGLVLEGRLLLPMRDRGGQITSLQAIDDTGRKRFLKGGVTKGSSFLLARGDEPWLVEGYATGLSVLHALRMAYQRPTVVVCFSAYNIAEMAKRFDGYVVADNDDSGTGQQYAEATGLPWWMPPEVGTDANDFMRLHPVQGLKKLSKELMKFRSAAIRQRQGS